MRKPVDDSLKSGTTAVTQTAASQGAVPYCPLPAAKLRPEDEYDEKQADAAVSMPQLLQNPRFWELVLALVRYCLLTSMSTLLPEKQLTAEQRARARAQDVRELLFDLGPTFIKLGQFLSVRRDILPLELAEELTHLQDKVPPFSLDLVRQTVTAELGAPPEALFLTFDPTPIACASIGQVHRVQFHDGRWAVLKVQRPGLASEFYRDLGLMRFTARFLMRACDFYDKYLGWLPIRKEDRLHARDFEPWMELSDEFGRTLFSEIDYLLEGRNADRLRQSLRHNQRVRIPRVYWKYTGRRVLALEYATGIKISRVDELAAQGFDLVDIGNLLVNCYLEQIVMNGFFHADPHAGNLAVDQYGNLIIYDYGMMGELSDEQRHALLSCVLAVVRKEPTLVTRNLVQLGIVSKRANVETVSRTITPFIDYYSGRDIMDLDFRNLEQDIDQVISERSFRLPANLAYLLRAGSSLEGIARTLQPDFSFVQAVKPVMTKWVLKQGIETLAKNGRLLEFAELAISEVKRSRAKEPSDIDNKSNGKGDRIAAREIKGHGKETRSQSSNTKDISVTASTSATDVNFQQSNGNQAPGLQPITPTNCPKCASQENKIRNMERERRDLFIWGMSYLVGSLGLITFLVNAASTEYRQVSLYFLIGIIILGALIFWKLTRLLRSSPLSAEVEKTAGNGDRQC